MKQHKFNLAAYVKKQAEESGVPEFIEDTAILVQAAELTASIISAD